MITFDKPVSAKIALNTAIIECFDHNFVYGNGMNAAGGPDLLRSLFIGSLGGGHQLTRIQRELDEIGELFLGVDGCGDEDPGYGGFLGFRLYSCDGRSLVIFGTTGTVGEGLHHVMWENGVEIV